MAKTEEGGMHGRRVILRKCAGDASAALLTLAPWTVPLSSPGPGQPPTPMSGGEAAGDHSREYRFKLSPESFAAVLGFDRHGILDYSIPLSRVFKRGGGLVLELKEPKGDLSKLLDLALKAPTPSNTGPSLSAELSRLQGDHGRPVRVSDLGWADL